MKNRWKLWVAGIALAQLLVIGVDVAMWPQPCEAEAVSGSIRLGMTVYGAKSILGDRGTWLGTGRYGPLFYVCKFGDGSKLIVTLGRIEDTQPRIVDIDVTPPAPVHPLTRLRRSLAHIIPALGE